jgi:cystathionine gamma-lyase
MSHAEESKELSFSTRAIHAGHDPNTFFGVVCPPISLATTYQQKSPGDFQRYEYSRTGNPTRETLEKLIASLEKGKYGLAFSSGSAATATVVNMLQAGDHIVTGDDLYGGTNRYYNRVAAKTHGFVFDMVDTTVADNVAKAVTEKTKLIWLETPTNPTLKITDIAEVSKVAKAKNPDVIVVVDNTFATPYFQNPLELGADIVVHSATKYINGHSDVVMGLLVTNRDDLRERIAFLQNGVGAVPSPFDCYLVIRGIRTLALRMEQHQKNAIEVAKFLESHDAVEKVLYPGLESHPQHAIFKKQMSGFGGMVTFFIKGGEKQARKFLETTKLFILAESLGAVESLCEYPLRFFFPNFILLF